MVIGILAITALPTVTGIAEGVHHQRLQNKEAADETRLAKFYLDVFCSTKSSKKAEVDKGLVFLRDDKIYIFQKPAKADKLKPNDGSEDEPADHPFTGFYLQYPDEERETTRGLVSTICNDPPMLNWLYVDRNTLELKYGNRTQSREHHVGPWDWTEDEVGLTLEGWEGFVAVEEGKKLWAIYFDRKNDQLKELRNGRRVLQCSLERRLLPSEDPEVGKSDRPANIHDKG